MSRAIFISVSVMWAMVGAIIWAAIQFDCGLGPDSPEACNIEADSKARRFLIFLPIAYAIFAATYWSRRARKGR